jgi:hypothetical protein
MLGALATTVYARLRLWHTVVPPLAMAVSTGHALGVNWQEATPAARTTPAGRR